MEFGTFSVSLVLNTVRRVMDFLFVDFLITKSKQK